jgi:hypothetical protein
LGGSGSLDRDWWRTAAGVGALALAVAVAAVTLVVWTGRERDQAPGALGGSHHRHGSHVVVSGSGPPDPVQIETIRAAMARYEDIDVARAEGWGQEHGDEPGIGAHFARAEDGEEEPPTAGPGLDLVSPEYLMYSRIGRDDWELVAVAYVVDRARWPEPPTDLHGAIYHQHVWSCVVDGEELDEEDFGTVSRGECRARHGRWSPGGVWMTHVWLVDNPAGPFAETNPALV